MHRLSRHIVPVLVLLAAGALTSCRGSSAVEAAEALGRAIAMVSRMVGRGADDAAKIHPVPRPREVAPRISQDAAIDAEIRTAGDWVALAEGSNSHVNDEMAGAVDELTNDLVQIPDAVVRAHAKSGSRTEARATVVDNVRGSITETAKELAKGSPALWEVDLLAGKVKLLRKARIGSVEVSVGQIDVGKLSIAIGGAAYACYAVSTPEERAKLGAGNLAKGCVAKAKAAILAAHRTPIPQSTASRRAS